MSLEVGTIVKGKVTGITNFGAFVEIEGGKRGMVHISEISRSYVEDIKKVLSIGQAVECKIVSIADDGRWRCLSSRLSQLMMTHQSQNANSQNENLENTLQLLRLHPLEILSGRVAHQVARLKI